MWLTCDRAIVRDRIGTSIDSICRRSSAGCWRWIIFIISLHITQCEPNLLIVDDRLHCCHFTRWTLSSLVGCADKRKSGIPRNFDFLCFFLFVYVFFSTSFIARSTEKYLKISQRSFVSMFGYFTTSWFRNVHKLHPPVGSGTTDGSKRSMSSPLPHRPDVQAASAESATRSRWAAACGHFLEQLTIFLFNNPLTSITQTLIWNVGIFW